MKDTKIQRRMKKAAKRLRWNFPQNLLSAFSPWLSLVGDGRIPASLNKKNLKKISLVNKIGKKYQQIPHQIKETVKKLKT